jgi:hypothetical protein
MQMTALDLKAWNTRQCLPGRPRFIRPFGVRSDRRVYDGVRAPRRAGWALIMRTIKCLKGIRRMPWR